MAMARSSLKGMWSFSCEGGTYLYTQGKMGASFILQTWRRGLICLLVLASLPFTAPMIVVSILVGGVFLVPLLCGVAAYYALFRPASLSNITKWFRSPKSVLRSGSTELVMEDLDVHDDGNRDHGASLGVFNLDRKDVADSSNVGIAAEEEDSALGVLSSKELAVNEEIMEDKDVVLHGRDGRAQEEDNRPSDSLLSQELVEAKSFLEESGEHYTDDSYPVAENQDLESEEAEYNAFHFGDQERVPGEDQSMTVEPSDKDPLEDEFPILEITQSGIPLEELNLPADKEEPYQVQVIDNQQEQLEEPKQLEEGLPEEAPEEGLPDDPDESHVVTEDEVSIVQEKGIEIPFVGSEPVSEEKEVPAVEEEDVPAPSLESEVSMMEQHSLPVESEPVELAPSVKDVPAVAEAAPVPEAVSASASVEESDAKDVEAPEAPEAPMGEEKEKADLALESSASVTDQQSLPVNSEPVELASSVTDIPAIAGTAPVQEGAALVEEFDVKEAEVPEAPMVKENEVEASVEEAGISEADALVVEPDVAKEAASESAAPEVAPEEKAQFVQEKEVELPLVASELVSEESEVPVVEEEDAPSLESEVSMMEQHSLPVVSEPVDLVSSIADVPAIEEAALMEEAALVEVYASAEEAPAEKVKDPETPVAEDKEMKAPVASLEEVKIEEQPVVLAPAQEGAAPEAETPVVEPELTEEVKANPAALEAVEEDEDVELLSVVSEPLIEEKETLVVAEDVEAAPTLLESEPLVVEEKSSLEEEAAPVEDAAPVGEGVVEKGEESEAPVVDVKEIMAPVAALEETLAEEGATPEAEAHIDEVVVTEEAEAGPAASEVFAEEAQIVQDKVELPLVVSEPIVEAPEVDEASISIGLEPRAPVIVEKSLPAEEAIQVQQPDPPVVEEKEAYAHVAETSIEEKVDEAPEAEVLVKEPEVTKDAPPASIAAEEAPDVREVELPLAASSPVSEEKEAPGVEESLAVPKSELEAPVVAEKSLPLQEVQVEAAPVEETLVNKVGEPEAPAVEKTEGADDTTLHISSKVGSGTSSEASTTVETISSLDKDIIDGFKSHEHGSEDITTSEAKAEFERGERHDRISSDLEPPSNVEDSSAVDENLEQASKDRIIKVSNLEVEDAPLTSASSSTAQLLERGNEADEEAQKLEENLEKDKAVESHIEQDVFPTLKPLNVVQSKDYSHDEQAEESDSISTLAPAQRRISFENVRADEEVNIGAPSSPHRTGVQGTNFVFKSRLGRDHPTHRHSAPDFLATQTWVREAPLYSPQESFRGHKKAKYKKWPEFEGARPAEPHMGEFESLLQSWQERNKATHSPTSISPSGSPRSPAEIGRQIREEISTIQKIIGQEIPPQYSLWKAVETLCQVVGMELPYMGDVSDLTKARQGLDLLKVVVGIKWT